MSDAPEKILVSKCGKTLVRDGMKRFETDVYYTRADVAQAMVAKAREEREMFAWAMEAVAKAREDALREAYQNLRTFAPHHEQNTGPEHDVGYAAGYHTAMNRIEALIDRTAEGDTNHDQ